MQDRLYIKKLWPPYFIKDKKEGFFEAWKMKQWFYSFWLFVCLILCIMKQTYHSYPRKVKKINTGINRLQPQIFCHKKLQANDQKITLKMLIHKGCVFFMFSNTSTTFTPWKDLFWFAPTEVPRPSESGQQTKKTSQKAMEKDSNEMWRCEKSLMEAGSSKDKHTGNFGKTRVLLGFEIPEVHWVSSMIQCLGQFFSMGRKSGTKTLQALKNCKKWWDGVSIRASNGILWFQHFSISLWMDIQWMSVFFQRCVTPVRLITQWFCLNRNHSVALYKVHMGFIMKGTIPRVQRMHHWPFEMVYKSHANQQTKKSWPGVFDFLKFGLSKQATWESCTTWWCWFRRTHRYRTWGKMAQWSVKFCISVMFTPRKLTNVPCKSKLRRWKVLSKSSLLLGA